MSSRIRVAAAMLAWAAVLFIVRPADAAGSANSATIPIAFVDVARVMNEAKPIADLDSEFRATLAAQQKQLDNLYAGRLLDDKERTELEADQKLASPSDVQRKRMADLAKLSDDREQELGRLMRLEKPSDADQARRTELAGWLDHQNQRVAQLQETLNQERQQKQADITRKAMDLILATVRGIAQERGIEMVLDRQAVLFGRDDRDLTDVVLQQMNGATAASARKKGG